MMLGYVDSAIVTVRAVAAAETRFAKAHPELGHTCTLSQLPHDGPVARLADERDDNGYAFQIVGCQAQDPKKANLIYYVTGRRVCKRSTENDGEQTKTLAFLTVEKSPFHQQPCCECKRLITSIIRLAVETSRGMGPS